MSLSYLGLEKHDTETLLTELDRAALTDKNSCLKLLLESVHRNFCDKCSKNYKWRIIKPGMISWLKNIFTSDPTYLRYQNEVIRRAIMRMVIITIILGYSVALSFVTVQLFYETLDSILKAISYITTIYWLIIATLLIYTSYSTFLKHFIKWQIINLNLEIVTPFGTCSHHEKYH